MEPYDEIMSALSEMESRYRDGFSSSDRLLLDKLHRAIFGKEITNTGCSDCYRDAWLLIKVKLTKDKKMPTKPNYVLKGGAIIHPLGTSEYYTNPLPSDDIAEAYLAKYPAQISLFAEYPHDWDARVAAYRSRQAEKEEQAKAEVIANSQDIEQARTTIAGYQEEQNKLLALVKEKNDTIKAQESEIEELKKALDEKEALLEQAPEENLTGDVDSELQMEVETLKAELESASKEIADLKSENRALKAANTRLKNNGAKEAE